MRALLKMSSGERKTALYLKKSREEAKVGGVRFLVCINSCHLLDIKGKSWLSLPPQ
jgi:hypothetical protein